MDYQASFIDILQRSVVWMQQKEFPVSYGVEKLVQILTEARDKKKNVFLIGNGASASIASHIGTDFLKTLHIKAIHISDNSLLTCISNDLGYENVYAQPLEILAESGDVLLAISSSGQSPNILHAVETAQNKECTVITLSGFAEDNPLSQMGEVNFYVPSHRYGFVEIIHTYILHWIVDSMVNSERMVKVEHE